MAWDFRTDPEFQEQLDWIRDLVVNQIEPLDLVKHQMSPASWKRATAPEMPSSVARRCRRTCKTPSRPC